MASPKLRTRHNYDAFEVVSALQKCIRPTTPKKKTQYDQVTVNLANSTVR